MSNKLNAIREAVFYSKERPEKLAEIISGLVTDVATSITISGADSIEIPASNNTTSDYTATVFSQYGDKMTGTSVTLALKTAVTGVSISNCTVTVASTCTASSFILKATSGTVTKEKTIALT